MIFNDKIKFLNVIYPPLSGGNHLINLISLNYNIVPKLSSNSQHTNILDFYKKKLQTAVNDTIQENLHRADYASKGFNVHIYDTKNVFPDPYLNISQNLMPKEQCTLVHGHYFDYETNLLNNLVKNLFFKNLPYSLFCVLTVPNKKNSRLFRRLNNSDLLQNYIITKSLSNYVIPMKIVGYTIFDEMNSLLIDSDLFGEETGSEYLQDIIFKKFKLELPNDIHDIHKLWINMIDISLEYK